jgi:hypothetical protein
MLDLSLGVLLRALVNIHPLLDFNIGALEVEVLTLLFQGVVRDHSLHEGVNEMVDAVVPFTEQEFPLEDVMPPRRGAC